MELPKYLKIHLEGGIGDCLKIIMCNFPLQSLYDNYGIQTFVTYGGEHYNDCGWEKILQTELLDLCNPFIYVKREAFAQINCPTVADFFRKPKPFSLELSKYLPLDLKVDIVAPQIGKRHIGIQLDSNDPRKKFATKKWKELIDRILKKYNHSDIYLFGAPHEKESIDAHIPPRERLYNTCGNSLAESLCMISKMDLFISPDSFSKYACLCYEVPAIILCTRLPYISVHDMLETCFKNIHANDNFRLLGLNPGPVKSINDIPTSDILNLI